MTKPRISKIKGGVTAAPGYRAGGVSAGIKPSGAKDLALVVSDQPAVAAAVYTRNQIKAAPVLYNMRHVNHDRARAIIVNSGNANACTGPIGMIHARAMAAGVARRIGCDEDEVFVCSTGRIGVRLPSVKIQAGIKKLLGIVSATGGAPAAEAIMTSDSCPKEYAVRVTLGGKRITIGGMAKGAGMIHPNMATMLGFLTTDAVISPRQLKQCLATAVNRSFNRISVDGDMSTNDTVILLANGMAGNKTLDAKSMAVFQAAVNEVALALALMIVRDGEGTSRVVTVEVSGATSDTEAEVACRAVCNSVLVKTSWCGGDPNWGRIMDALGYCSARVREEKINIAYDNVLAVRHGGPVKNNTRKLKQIAAQSEFTLSIDLNQGRGRCTMYSTDLTEAYVEFNKSE